MEEEKKKKSVDNRHLSARLLRLREHLMYQAYRMGYEPSEIAETFNVLRQNAEYVIKKMERDESARA